MFENKPTTLHLENGVEFNGLSFGYDQAVSGEVVFSTAMVGYPESLTDPSSSGQILCVTFPLVGNYGVPADEFKDNLSKYFESEKIHVKGLIINDYSFKYSHWNAVKSLHEWLKENKVPGIFGVDTREITKILREKGSMLGKIIPENRVLETEENPNIVNQVAVVSCKEVIKYGNGRKRVVVVDCGVKHNIIRCLINRGVEVIRVPWDYNFNTIEYDGLFLSNGPGNPDFCDITIKNIKKAIEAKFPKPIFGICLGNQLLSKAGGATTYKLKYGHRSHNQPVIMAGTNRCFITAQNHGYAVDNSTLSADWEPLFINMNDGTNEGIKHKSKPFLSCQFHPEACGGPTDTEFLFDNFVNLL